MSNSACLTSLPFSITGNVLSAGNAIDLHFDFDSPADQATVLAYEWYLDDLLIIDQTGAELTIDVACGNHQVSGRILTAEGWSGRKKIAVETCVFAPSTLNYTLNEQGLLGAPYVDINLQFKDEGVSVKYVTNTETGTLQIDTGHTFTIEAVCETAPAAEITGAFIQLKVVKNGSVVFDQSIPAVSYLSDPSARLLFSDTAGLADVYEVLSFSGSDALVRYKLVEQGSPYCDANLAIKVNGVQVARMTNNGEEKVYAPHGAGIEFIAFCEVNVAAGVTLPKMYLTVKLNGVSVFDFPHLAAAGESFSYTTTVDWGVYDVLVASSTGI
jgi:hypothetical protein